MSKSIPWLGRYIDFTYITMWGEFWKDYELGFHAPDNPYNSEGFFKLHEDYGNTETRSSLGIIQELVRLHRPWLYDLYESSKNLRDFWMWDCSKYQKSIRGYAYLILSSQTSVRSGIIDNMASALTAQKAFLNNLETLWIAE